MVAATTATAICSLSRTCIIILCLYHVHFVLINDILIWIWIWICVPQLSTPRRGCRSPTRRASSPWGWPSTPVSTSTWTPRRTSRCTSAAAGPCSSSSCASRTRRTTANRATRSWRSCRPWSSTRRRRTSSAPSRRITTTYSSTMVSTTTTSTCWCRRSIVTRYGWTAAVWRPNRSTGSGETSSCPAIRAWCSLSPRARTRWRTPTRTSRWTSRCTDTASRSRTDWRRGSCTRPSTLSVCRLIHRRATASTTTATASSTRSYWMGSTMTTTTSSTKTSASTTRRVARRFNCRKRRFPSLAMHRLRQRLRRRG